MTQNNLNGIQFKLSAPPLDSRGYVHAYDDDLPADRLGRLKEIGYLYWFRGDRQASVTPLVETVSVAPKYQHRGIATRMYQMASEYEGQAITHSSKCSDAGDAWARRVGGHRLRRRNAR